MASKEDVKAFAHEARISLAESTANFDANAILRGAQLTVVGGQQNTLAPYGRVTNCPPKL